MSGRSIARRYAGALFDVASRAGIEQRAGEEVAAFAALVDGHPELKKTLTSAAVPAFVKKDIVAALVGAAGDLSPQVGRLLVMLAERDRLGALPAIVADYEARRMAARRVVPAEVVSAMPLTPASRSALADALGRATDRQVVLSERVDPALIGGLVARVGSLVFDGSVSRQLERLRASLLAGA